MASPTEHFPTRPMRLKVLYTFDADSKNNCLARWPHVLHVQTAFVDDLTQIGVVELKICLEALTSSSPELLSQDNLDYTIYAYDYSEEGVPLSGQGMLSSVFNPNSQDDSADFSSKVVTGRVTKNMLGLFAGNGQETLEVKLRLLPVAKQGQSRGMHAQSGFAGNNGQSLDMHAWSNPQQQDTGSNFRQQSASTGSPVDTTGLEHMQRMLHEGSAPREPPAHRSSEHLGGSSNSRPGSRSGTPGSAQAFNPPTHQSFSHVSRPSSRASVRAISQPVPQKRRESFNSGYYSGDEAPMEEGPPKKRAKITQVGAPTRSDLNIERQPESLRMAASTASSVRVHRPVAVNPVLNNLQGGNLREEPVRPPTPIPAGKKPAVRRLQTEPSNLRRASQQPLRSEMSHLVQPATEAADVSATSPEFTRVLSVTSTPANIPSSPPVMTNYGSMPSSPMLPPPPPEQHDSGFMSGFDDLTGENAGFLFDEYLQGGDHNAFQLQPTIGQNINIDLPNPYPVFEGVNNIEDEANQPTLPPPPKMSNQSAPSKQPASQKPTVRPMVRPANSSPRLAPAPYPRARQLEEEMATQPSLPFVPASDPAGRQLHRSNTWAGDTSDIPMSDALTGEGGRTKSVSKKKVGREQTKARLENALAQNEMPPYCDNCGTIDTPAWRRVFARTLPGHLWETVELWPETSGAFVWKQVVDQADDGTIRTFRAYKTSKNPEDKGDEWTIVTLCNPCGLWFHKNKCMRPQEKWMKNPKDPNEKKKRAYRPKSKRVAAKKGQDDDSKSNAPEPNSEGSSPADGATEAELEGEDENQRLNTDMIDPQLRSLGGNAPNAEPTGIVQGDAPVDGPSTRPPTGASQSSPDQTEGSHTHPVEGDLTPKPLRRQLFPSPTNKPSPNSQAPVTKDKSAKPLSELPNICRRSPRINKTVDVLNTNPETPKASNKENQFSRTADDDLHDLFNDEEDGFQLPPQTPTPTRRSDRLLLKTPSRTPSGGNPVTRSISANDRPPLQEVKTPKRDFIMGSNRTVEEMTPFTRMIHEELIKNAPKAKKANSNNNTPNSQLAQSQQSHKSDLNFSDLPTLDVSPMSMSRQPAFASLDRDTMDFGGVEFSDLFARPAGPGTGSGSPPDGYYHFLNEDFLGAGWVGMGGGQGQPRGEGKNGHGEEGGLGVSQPQIQSPPLRRSPRRNR